MLACSEILHSNNKKHPFPIQDILENISLYLASSSMQPDKTMNRHICSLVHSDNLTRIKFSKMTVKKKAINFTLKSS